MYKDTCGPKTLANHHEKQGKPKQHNHRKPKTTRKSPSQICVSPQSKTAKQQKTGQGPTKTKNTFRFALDTVTLATVSSTKTCKLITNAAVHGI